MLTVGIMIYGMLFITGHYFIDGVGYSAIQETLSGRLQTVWLLALLFVMKLLATCLTLGSGGSGGIFSPALFLGATAGGAFGLVCQQVLPSGLAASPTAFAVAGMAGMVGGATGAPMTAIVMIFEMTLDYSVILPITITVALSYSLRTMLCKESIYTLKLVRRGHFMPAALQVNFLQLRSVRDVMCREVATIEKDAGMPQLRELLHSHPEHRWFMAVDQQRVAGVLSRESIWASLDDPTLVHAQVADIMNQHFIFATEDEKLASLAERMHHPHTGVAVVLGGGGHADSVAAVVGLISWENITEAVEDSVDLFSEYREGS